MLPLEGSTETSTAFSDAIAHGVAARLGLITSLTDLRDPPWVASVQRQISKLQQLEAGWDGFHAGPVRRDVLEYTRRLLETVMIDDTPPPHIAPMSHEGVLVEWHVGGINLEIEIQTPGEAWVSYEDEEEGLENSWSVRADFRSLSEPIDELARRCAERIGS